jgi:hypothetical protein
MAGSGGRDSGFGINPKTVLERIREQEKSLAEAEFSPKLAELLDSCLARVNSRDAEAVRTRLDEIKARLEDMVGESVDLLFGGSVAKHTYVDGLSDIDSLLILRPSVIAGDAPSDVLETVASALRGRLEGRAAVSAGRIAVSVEYRDGLQIQLVPGVRKDERLRVPSFRGDRWSDIDPTGFEKALTNRNRECNGKLVPTIKLAKIINDALPEASRLSGYHIESLAIAAFRLYQGPKVASKMISFFFEKIPDLLSRPIADSSGQSVHVDDYLGPADSAERKQASHLFARIATRMDNATGAQSLDRWRAILGDFGKPEE